MNHLKTRRVIIGGVSIGILGLIVWLGGALYIRLNANTLLFEEQYSYNGEVPEKFTQMFIAKESPDSIDVWHVRNDETDRVILQLHGRGGRQAQMVQRLSQYGSVYAPAYPGYSHTEGETSVVGTKRVAVQTYDWLVNTQDINPQKITVIGYSLGSSPALYLATQRSEFNELVLIGAYNSVQDMCGLTYGLFCVLSGDVFPNQQWASQVEVPVRQFHVKGDDEVPVSQGRKLNQAFQDKVPFTLLDGVTHSYPNLAPVFE